jgi:hypothetical protein
MALLDREFPRIVENSSDPRPGVKRGSAFGRSSEEQRHAVTRISRVLDTLTVQGLSGATAWSVELVAGRFHSKKEIVDSSSSFQHGALLGDASIMCRILAVNVGNSACICSDFPGVLNPLSADLILQPGP